MLYFFILGISILFIVLELLVFAIVVVQLGWIVAILLTGISMAVGLYCLFLQGVEFKKNNLAMQPHLIFERGNSIIEVLLGLCASALLLLPGFLTDILALLLLLPLTKKVVEKKILKSYGRSYGDNGDKDKKPSVLAVLDSDDVESHWKNTDSSDQD